MIHDGLVETYGRRSKIINYFYFRGTIIKIKREFTHLPKLLNWNGDFYLSLPSSFFPSFLFVNGKTEGKGKKFSMKELGRAASKNFFPSFPLIE